MAHPVARAPTMDWLKATDLILNAAATTFGEQVTYAPKAGGSFTVSGIFSNGYLAENQGMGVVSTSTTPMLGVKLSSFASPPLQGDKLTVRGDLYRVTDPQPDGQGGALLMLEAL